MKAYKTLLFIWGILILLGIISVVFPEDGITIAHQQLYFPTIEDMANKESGHSTTASVRMKEIEESLRIRNIQDSLAHAESLAYQDSLNFYLYFFENNPSRIYLPKNNYDYFNELFEAFDESKNSEVIHLLHYGDSQIEADRITGTIREKLQERFCGNGPGLLPAIQPIPSAAVGQTANGPIERYIIAGAYQNKLPHRRYGALGQVGGMSGESSVFISTRNWKGTYEHLKTFDYVRLFAGHTSSNFRVDLITSDKRVIAGTKTNINASLDVYTWRLDQPIKRFTLQMYGSGEIYGISADGATGVAMDNIPFRGSSGTFYSSIDSTLLTSMYQALNTRLLLLEFGGNTVPFSKSEKAIQAYKDMMSKQIAYLRQICPEAKITLIGPADMATKVQGKLQSYPHLESFIQALKEAALENDAAFWDMFGVMGGHNSMIDWVKNSPSLAAPDYIHFNNRGAARMGELFFESLMIYYDYYTFTQEHKKKELKDE